MFKVILNVIYITYITYMLHKYTIVYTHIYTYMCVYTICLFHSNIGLSDF